MNSCHSTLWMGNIESWMNHYYLSSLLNSANIYPSKIIIKNPINKRGCAFLVFNTQEMAKNILDNFNGKKIKNIDLKFNWVRTLEEKYSSPKITKFTVRFLFYNINFQLFVGNIDKSISFDEVKKYFYERYTSIISAKLITDQETNRSKGYGFIEFTNYKEFKMALCSKEPVIFGKQKLVFNSAKNKYDEDDEINTKNNSSNIEDSASLKTSDSSNSSSFAFISSPLESYNCSSLYCNNEDSKSKISNNNTSSFLGNNEKPKIENLYKDNDTNNLLTLQIKYALKNISISFSRVDPLYIQSSMFNYFCRFSVNINLEKKHDFNWQKNNRIISNKYDQIKSN